MAIIPDPKVPRSATEINSDFNDTCARLGFAQNQIYLRKKEIEDYNKRITVLNDEMNLRQKLDKEAAAAGLVETPAPEATPAPETTNA